MMMMHVPSARRGLLRPLWLLGLLLLALPAALPARDAYVVISGGGTPLGNNYSQYLQARAMAAFLRARYPAGSTWVFYGAGNREGEPAVFVDTRRQYKRDGLVLESWLPAALPDNRPATRASILAALRDEILPAVADGGTLYLFVGDHGERTTGESPQSAITLWQMKRRDGGSGSWYTDPAEVLGVDELRDVLQAGLGRGRVVFCMTQCYSGGFQFLGVPREVTPDSNWFTATPAWAAPVDVAPPRIAGFTATDEHSLAAGCDPDPDPDSWEGYERFVPEALLGIDLFTLRRSDAGLPSFAAAHRAAVLVDKTIDRPRSSAEQYLESWATLIETRLADEPALRPDVRREVESYVRAVDAGLASADDPDFRARRDEFARRIAWMAETAPALRDLVTSGARADLEPPPARSGGGGGGDGGGARSPLRQAWEDVLRPAWKQAVLAGEAGLTEPALAFERHLLELEDKGRQLMIVRGWRDPLLNEIYWSSGYADVAGPDEARAVAVARWGAERGQRIAAWGAASPDAAVREAADKLERYLRFRRPPATAQGAPEAGAHRPGRPLARTTAAARVLFYRRVLAAWAFLLATDDRPALAQLHAYLALENTPLPPGR